MAVESHTRGGFPHGVHRIHADFLQKRAFAREPPDWVWPTGIGGLLPV